MKRGKKERSILKSVGSFFIRLFIALILLRLFLFFYRIKDPFAFPGIDPRINFILIVSLFLGLIFYLPFLFKKSKSLSHIQREEYVKILLNYLFQFVTLGFCILFILSFFNIIIFNLNYVFVLVVFLGILSLIFFPHKKKGLFKEERIKLANIFFMIILSFLAALPIFLITKPLGFTGIFVSLGIFILVFILVFVLLKEKEND